MNRPVLPGAALAGAEPQGDCSDNAPASFSHQVIALLGILALWLIMAGEFLF